MPFNVNQASFAGGELAPSLYGRVDLQKYYSACKTLKNWLVHSHGGASTRPGTVFIAATKYADRKARLERFIFNNDQAYVLEIGHQYIRFFADGGQLLSGSNIYEITTPYLEDDIDNLQFVQSADVIYIVHPDYRPRQLERYGHTDWLITDYDYQKGPLLSENDTDTTLTIDGSIQVAKPISDISTGSWMPTSGTTLYNMLDEDEPNDNDGIRPYDTNSSTCEIKLSAIDTPTTKKGHILKVRTGIVTTSYINLSIELLCGTTVIREFALRYRKAYITNMLFLTKEEAESITDYTDLRVKLTGGDAEGRVTWISFQAPMPESGGTAVTVSDGSLFADDAITVQSSNNIFQSGHIGSIWGVRYIANSQSYEWLTPSTGECVSSAYPVYGNWSLLIRPLGYKINEAPLYVEKSLDDGRSWIRIKTIPATEATYDIETTGFESGPCFLRIVRDTAPAEHDEGLCILNITGQESWAYFKITEVSDSTHAVARLISDFTRPGATLDTWAEAAWSDVRGWPTCAVFYEDRLVFGSTETDPQKLWCTETGDYYNFGRSFPLTDTDRIVISLLSREINQIRKMISLSEIIALTSSADWKIGPASNTGIFSPTSVSAKCQSYRGCANVDPITVGNRAIYVQAMGSVVRDIGYSFESDGYSGDDLSLFASHLTKNYSIKEMTYQQEPDSIIWMVRNDGMLLGMTYVREQQVLAWHKHQTEGQFESITSIPGEGYNELWAIVKRGGNRYIERFAKRLPTTDPADQICMDSAMSYDGVPVNQVSGLDHLEGMEVAILADGFVMPRQTVANGTINLDILASKIHVGLPFTADLQTLGLEIQSSNGQGLQGKLVRINNVTIAFENSRGGLVGINEDELDAIIERTNEPYGEPIALQNGKRKFVIQGTFEEDASILVRQADPLPMTILSIIPSVTPGG